MLRFRIGPIPVHVEPGHFLTAAVLGLNAFQILPPQLAMPYFISWIAIVFFSVLIHELGHAVVSLAFGYRPSIRLVWMGGLTQPNAPGPIPWYAETLLTLAGPGFGIAVWLLSLGVREMVRPSTELSVLIFHSLIAVNRTWSLLNLAPIQPLDGGHVSSALLTRAFGRPGFLAAQILGLLTSAVLIGWIVLTRQDLFFAIFLAFFAVRAISNIAAYFLRS